MNSQPSRWYSGTAQTSKTGRTRSNTLVVTFASFFLDRNSNSTPPVLRPEFKSHFKADGVMFLTSSLVRTLIPKYETIKSKHFLKMNPIITSEWSSGDSTSMATKRREFESCLLLLAYDISQKILFHVPPDLSLLLSQTHFLF